MNKEHRCQCYHCFATFAFDEIVEFWDDQQTPVCPDCGVDSVQYQVMQLTELQGLHDKMFKIVKPNKELE